MLSTTLERIGVPRRPKDEQGRPYPNVAAALSDLRRAAEITQEEMARRVNLTHSGYRTYEQGKRNLTQDQIPTYARALGVPIAELIKRLWPDELAQDQPVETHYSNDWAEIQQQVAGLPSAQRERILRNFRTAIEIAQGGPLARHN